MLEIKIIADLTEKKLYWYDLVECECRYEQNLFNIYLPAALLKVKGILTTVDLGNDKQYFLDFNNFKKSGRNIDMLFDNYLKNDQYPVYKEMFIFLSASLS